MQFIPAHVALKIMALSDGEAWLTADKQMLVCGTLEGLVVITHDFDGMSTDEINAYVTKTLTDV